MIQGLPLGAGKKNVKKLPKVFQLLGSQAIVEMFKTGVLTKGVETVDLHHRRSYLRGRGGGRPPWQEFEGAWRNRNVTKVTGKITVKLIISV